MTLDGAVRHLSTKGGDLGFHCPSTMGNWDPAVVRRKGTSFATSWGLAEFIYACRPHSGEGFWRVGLGRDWAVFGLATSRAFVRV